MIRALPFLRRHPDLILAWLCVLSLPPLISMLPLDLSLQPLLDLRPAADLLVAAPADDGLWTELANAQPTLVTTALGSLAIALLVGTPLLWLLCAAAAGRALDVRAPLGRVLGRGLGVTLLALPLRVLVWIATLAAAAQAAKQQTLVAAMPYAVGAVLFYLGAGVVLTIFVDVLRGVALSDLEAPLVEVFARALSCIHRAGRTFAALCALELGLLLAAAVPVLASRPLGILGPGPSALALAGLVVRAAGGVAGVALATNVASRSA